MQLSKKQIIAPAVWLLVASQALLSQSMDTGHSITVIEENGAVPVLESAQAANQSAATELSNLSTQAPPQAVSAVVPAQVMDTLSVDFPDEDVRNVLRNVADLFELNIIVPDALSGRTSIKLRDVTWRQLYKVVLEPFGYTFVEDANIIKIVSRDSLQLEPFITESIPLVNVPATSVEPVLRPMLSPPRPATETDSAKAGGSLVLNSLANEVIVTDQPAIIRRMIDTVRRLDVEPRQVVIETKFMEIAARDAQSLGVRLSGRDVVGGGSSSTNAGANSLSGALAGNFASVISGAANSNVVFESRDFAALLTALSELRGTKIVSNPTIVAVNGSKSQITVGRDLQTVTVTQQVTQAGQPGQITFAAGEKIFEGVKVELTPQITSSKLVALQLTTEKSEAEEVPFDVPGSTTPQVFYNVRKREGTLNLILNDGQTAAIGGLRSQDSRTSNSKVPVLGDIPGLGVLFRNKVKTEEDVNLVIFITANILEPSKTTYRNLSTARQIQKLGATERDIEGVSYKPSAEEQALYDALADLRKRQQDEALKKELDLILDPPPARSSRR
jgi:type IV pilus assembly protein PilQ